MVGVPGKALACVISFSVDRGCMQRIEQRVLDWLDSAHPLR